MKPLKNYVLVIEAKKESTTASGIVLTGIADIGAKAGQVLETGPDVEVVKAGDRVAVDWSKGLVVEHRGERAMLISEEFIFGIY